MINEQNEKDYLTRKGFTYNPELNGYVLPIKKDNLVLGYIIVRFYGTGFITPIFRTDGVTFLSLPTLEHVTDLIDYFDRQLTAMECNL